MWSRRSFLQGAAAGGVSGLVLAGNPGPLGADAASIRSHPDAVTVALIGDYGSELPGQRAVARMVDSWNPAAVFTMGDNVYSADDRDPYDLLDRKVVSYYRRFVENGTFYPSLGNHDWGDPGTPLLIGDGRGGTRGAWHDVFDLPGNGRYFDVRLGPLHVFVLDDYYLEPDGNLAGSKQYQWFKSAALRSTAPLKIVVHHFPPYVTGGGRIQMRWPFAEWGIQANFTGHWHHYERRKVDGVHYIVNGIGGAHLGAGVIPERGVPLYADLHGASRLTASPEGFLCELLSVDGAVQDSVVQMLQPGAGGAPKDQAPPQPPKPTPVASGTVVTEPYLSTVGRQASIARLYLAVFARQPDADGFEYWTNLRASVSAMADFFVVSPEFVARFGSPTNSQFVDLVYRNVLGRAPDSAGRTYWLGLLNRGVSRGDVILGFSESPEFRSRTGIVG